MVGCGPRTVFWLAGSGLIQLPGPKASSDWMEDSIIWVGALGAISRLVTCSCTFWDCAMDPPSRVTSTSLMAATVRARIASM